MLNLLKSIYSKNFLLTQRGKVVSLTNHRSSIIQASLTPIKAYMIST